MITADDVRAAGGVVHSDGNVFFTSLAKLNILADRARRASGEPVASLSGEDITEGCERHGITVWGPRAEDFQAGARWAELVIAAGHSTPSAAPAKRAPAPTVVRPLTIHELADVTAPWSNIWSDKSFGIAETAIAKFCEVNGLATPSAPSVQQVDAPSGAGDRDKFDEVLQPFLTLMRKELHANTSKGDRPGWLKMDASTALLEVYYHVSKLQKAVRNNDGPGIQEYAADVANMSMMVLDVCGGIDALADQPAANPRLLTDAQKHQMTSDIAADANGEIEG